MQVVSCSHAKISGYNIIFVCEVDALLITAIKDGLWHAVVDTTKLNELCNLARQSRDQYTQNLLEAFNSPEPSSYFALKEDGSYLNFIWSKEIKKGIKIIFGSFCLLPSCDALETLCELACSVIASLSESISRSNDIERENINLKSLVEVSLKKYEEVVSRASDNELILLSKFSAVLNEKKRKLESSKCPSFMSNDSDKVREESSAQEKCDDDLLPSKDKKKSRFLIQGHRK
ncbi:x-ray repair cross complementing isoform 3 [Schistosoma japonicum]|uniref:X-ray repair cross complementing isoform 3 n=2 Tax=Schistosoma japonicum TaxID=6182 RepID=C1LHX8_SCHJA|nr:x-ray repair cross complementing [Schistosoma japonicum]KAH8867142.1 x-ray repair cross complementing [Schistosoma japonicum]KAH8867146.1 x-ray repair cross complementing [Schistosoma japonicum]TNN20226.1 x-ray repair cross complementing isoform 3 [Schistosoma japonicum]TNN20228.1 x-ray repair cross complementing isoform 3 [Schistosoma japonicum]